MEFVIIDCNLQPMKTRRGLPNETPYGFNLAISQNAHFREKNKCTSRHIFKALNPREVKVDLSWCGI